MGAHRDAATTANQAAGVAVPNGRLGGVLMVTELNFKCFTCTKEVQGVTRQFHFTTHDAPVTVNGVQFIPLSLFDQEVWGLLTSKSQAHRTGGLTDEDWPA